MVTSLSVATALWVSDTNDGKWISRDVVNRVNFVVDGRGLAELGDYLNLGVFDPVGCQYFSAVGQRSSNTIANTFSAGFQRMAPFPVGSRLLVTK